MVLENVVRHDRIDGLGEALLRAEHDHGLGFGGTGSTPFPRTVDLRMILPI